MTWEFLVFERAETVRCYLYKVDGGVRPKPEEVSRPIGMLR